MRSTIKLSKSNRLTTPICCKPRTSRRRRTWLANRNSPYAFADEESLPRRGAQAHLVVTRARRFFSTGLATAPCGPMVTNMGSSISASDNSATSYDGSAPNDGAATINSATIITAASAIFVVGIAGAAIVPAATCNCPPSNHRSAAIDGGSPMNCGSPVNCGASVN